MPSVVRKRSFGSVKTFWLDRRLVVELATEASRNLLAERPEVERVGIIGSIARDRAVPGSDLDLMVVLTHSQGAAPHRAAPYQPYYQHLDIGVDLLCFTAEEARKNRFFQRNQADAIWIARGG